MTFWENKIASFCCTSATYHIFLETLYTRVFMSHGCVGGRFWWGYFHRTKQAWAGPGTGRANLRDRFKRQIGLNAHWTLLEIFTPKNFVKIPPKYTRLAKIKTRASNKSEKQTVSPTNNYKTKDHGQPRDNQHNWFPKGSTKK